MNNSENIDFWNFYREECSRLIDLYDRDKSALESFELVTISIVIKLLPNDKDQQIELLTCVMDMMISAEKEGFKMGTIPNDILVQKAKEYNFIEIFVKEIINVLQNKF